MSRENRSYRVLIVDDDPSLGRIMAYFLQKQGYDTVLMNTARTALAEIDRLLPDLVLLDVTMPGMSGIEMLTKLRQSDRTRLLPVILNSALDRPEDIVTGLRAGANDYVTKPIDNAILLARVETQLKMATLLFELDSQRQLLDKLAAYDSLTEIYNRRSLMEVLDAQLQQARTHDRNLSLLMLDIDHFKQINDTHGHLVGDQALRGFAHLLEKLTRKADTVARFGGEEFTILMHGINSAQAIEAAERIRRTLENTALDCDGSTVKITVSIGISTFSADHPADSHTLIGEADRALYRAKLEGRNRVCLYDPNCTSVFAGTPAPPG
ncbi:MAG: diguanylate cyclase [Candidatus Sumerlaeaceae bacterium]|nr:diguanylate cyclase [Candidatus Sumerlaeaceae bacterium]